MAEMPDGTVLRPMRVMQLMDCVAGYNATRGEQPIAILLFAHRDEIEQPMMLSMHDSKRLVLRLLVALAEHGEEFAKDLLDENFTEQDPNDPFRVKHSDFDGQPLDSIDPKPVAYPLGKRRYHVVDQTEGQVPSPKPTAAKRHRPALPPSPSPGPITKPWTRRLTATKKSICKCVVQYTQKYRPRNSFFVLGGYTDGSLHFVLMRRRASSGSCEDGVAQVFPDRKINIWGDSSGNFLSDDQWEPFLKLTKGKRFTFNGVQWTKMTVETLATLTHGKTFKPAS